MWACKRLRTKHFHGVSSRNQHPYLLKSRYGKVRSLHTPLVGFALAPSLAFFIMTWDNLLNIVVHPWAGVRSDHTWTRWGRRKPWILVGVPLAVTGLLALPLAPTLAGYTQFFCRFER